MHNCVSIGRQQPVAKTLKIIKTKKIKAVVKKEQPETSVT